MLIHFKGYLQNLKVYIKLKDKERTLKNVPKVHKKDKDENMKIPNELEDKIEKQLENIKLTELKEISKNLSNKYMNEKRMGQSLLNKELEALAYSVIRMPATFCAINKVLEETIKRYNINIDTSIRRRFWNRSWRMGYL